MSDTCYPGMSVRTGKKILSPSFCFKNQFRPDTHALPFQALITSKSQDIQKRRRHQAWVHGGDGGTASSSQP